MAHFFQFFGLEIANVPTSSCRSKLYFCTFNFTTIGYSKQLPINSKYFFKCFGSACFLNVIFLCFLPVITPALSDGQMHRLKFNPVTLHSGKLLNNPHHVIRIKGLLFRCQGLIFSHQRLCAPTVYSCICLLVLGSG